MNNSNFGRKKSIHLLQRWCDLLTLLVFLFKISKRQLLFSQYWLGFFQSTSVEDIFQPMSFRGFWSMFADDVFWPTSAQTIFLVDISQGIINAGDIFRLMSAMTIFHWRRLRFFQPMQDAYILQPTSIKNPNQCRRKKNIDRCQPKNPSRHQFQNSIGQKITLAKKQPWAMSTETNLR